MLDKDNKKYLGADYVAVTTGCFNSPYTPKFNGAEDWDGVQMHSKYFRSPSKE